MQKIVFALIFILFLIMIPLAFARYPTQGYDFSVTNVSLSSASLVKGTPLTVTVTIKNVGTLLGSVKVYLGIKQPDGSNIYPSNGYVYDIAVSSSKNIALTWNIPTSAQTGTHYVDIDVYNTPETWLFDTTGFVYSFQVTPVQHDPAASCSSPSNSNVQITKGTSQTFVAYVTDSDGDLNYVENYLGGVYQGRGTSVSGSSGLSSWSHTFSTYGSFLVKAIVYDIRNDPNHVGSCQWTVNVGYDPTISRNSPGQSSITIIQGNSQTFTVNTNDLDGDLYIVEWYLQGQIQSTSSVSGSSALASWSHSFPSPGTFTVAATVYDSRYSSSHCATTSWTLTINQQHDPVASCGSPSTSNVQIPIGTSQTFVAHVTDADGDLNYVDYYLDHVHVGRGSSVSGFSADSSWSHTFSGYGTFLVEAEVYDSRNDPAHYGYCSWSVTVGYDPVAGISSPSTANFNLPYGALQTFVAHVTDSDGDLNYVEYYLNGDVERGSSVSGLSGDSSWTHIFNNSGTFAVEVVVYDNRNSGGHVGRCQWTVTVGSPPSWPVNLWSHYWKPEPNPNDNVPRDYSYVSVSGSQLSMNLPKNTALRNKIYLSESEQFDAVYATITVHFKILNPQPQPNYAIFLYSKGPNEGESQELDWEFSYKNSPLGGMQQVTCFYNVGSGDGKKFDLAWPWNYISSYSDWTTLQFLLRPNCVYVYINGSPATDPIQVTNSPTGGFTTQNMALYFETSQGISNSAGVASDFTSLIIDSVTIYTDTTPPSTPAPDDGVSGWSNVNTPTFSWSASSDSGSGVAGYYWKVDSGSESGPVSSGFTLPAQPDGSHTFQVRAKDNAGNYGSYGSHSFQIDTSAPSTPSPDDGVLGWSSDNTPTFNWAAVSDSGSGVAGYYWKVDSGPDYGPISTSVTLSAQPDGSHTFQVRAKDNAGNYGSYGSHSFQIDTGAQPNADPVVDYVHVWGYPGGLLDPAGSINPGESVRIFTGVSDLETSSDQLTVTIKYKAQPDPDWTAVLAQWELNYGGYWYYDWVIPGGTSSGLYDVMVEVSDVDGGSASATEYGEFTVNSNASPVVNYVHVWGYPGGLLDPAGTIKTGESVRIFTGITDTETPSNQLTVTIKYKAQADSVWTSHPALWEPLYGGYWYYDWVIPGGASSGLYDVMVEASDSDGGSVSVTEVGEFSVVSSNADPVVNYIHVWGYPGGLLDPAGTIKTGESVRIFSGVADAETLSSGLTVYISYKAQSDLSWTGPILASWEPLYGGYWYYDWSIPSGASAGLYDVKVEASDPDGGVATPVTGTSMFTVVKMNTNPVVNYVHVWGYPGGLLDPAGSIKSGKAVRIFAGIMDVETASDQLTVTIKYKAQADSVWTSHPALWEPLYGGYWYYDWVIPGGASSGLYDVMVEASDGAGGFVSVTEVGEFTVVA